MFILPCREMYRFHSEINSSQLLIIESLTQAYGINSIRYKTTAYWNFIMGKIPANNFIKVTEGTVKDKLTQYFTDIYKNAKHSLFSFPFNRVSLPFLFFLLHFAVLPLFPFLSFSSCIAFLSLFS